MKRYFLLLLILSVALYSCKRTKKDVLVRNWHAVGVDNPQLTEMIQHQQTFIDTVGKHTDAVQNEQLYGVKNIDSLKQALQLQLDSFKAMQRQSLDNTWFNFKKDGQAILTFGANVDTTRWYLDDDGALMLDELAQKGSGNKLKMQIVTLSDSILKLKFIENDMISTVTFHPEKK